MKKISKFILVLICFIPLILNAEEEKEWRWYTNIEENITYNKDAEQNCEYFDKDNYTYGEWIYTTIKPEEKEGREVIEETLNIPLRREYNNIIKISEFSNANSKKPFANMKIFELSIFDNLGNKVNYDFGNYNIENGKIQLIKDNDRETFIEVYRNSYIYLILEKPINIKGFSIRIVYDEMEASFVGLAFESYLQNDIFTNAFASYSTDNNKECEENICTMNIKTVEEGFYDEILYIQTAGYKYRDKYYKCYTPKKLYVPGYYKELDGFIKDESNYKTTEIKTPNETETTKEIIKTVYIKEEPKVITKNICEFPKPNQNGTQIKNEALITEVTEEELENNNSEISNTPDDKIAMVTNVNHKEKVIIPKFVLPIILISLLIITVIVTKKVKKSRAK